MSCKCAKRSRALTSCSSPARPGVDDKLLAISGALREARPAGELVQDYGGCYSDVEARCARAVLGYVHEAVAGLQLLVGQPRALKSTSHEGVAGQPVAMSGSAPHCPA